MVPEMLMRWAEMAAAFERLTNDDGVTTNDDNVRAILRACLRDMQTIHRASGEIRQYLVEAASCMAEDAE